MTAIGSLRVLRHELLLARRTWWGSAFSTFVAPILYLAGIGLGIGALVDDPDATRALGGVSYAAFAGTGLLAAQSMQTAVGDMSWPVTGAITHTRTWVASTSTPLAPGDLVGGLSLLLALRLAVSAAVFSASLLALGLVDPRGALAVVPPAIAVGLACGMPMFAFAAWTTSTAHISYVWRFLVIPLFILSGTFFPVSRLAAPVQLVAVLSPLWHGVELVRSAGLGQSPSLPWAVHLGVLALVGLLGGTVAVRTLTRRLQP